MDALDHDRTVRKAVLPVMDPADMRLDVALWQARAAANNRYLTLGDDPELSAICKAIADALDAFCRLRAKTYGVPV